MGKNPRVRGRETRRKKRERTRDERMREIGVELVGKGRKSGQEGAVEKSGKIGGEESELEKERESRENWGENQRDRKRE